MYLVAQVHRETTIENFHNNSQVLLIPLSPMAGALEEHSSIYLSGSPRKKSIAHLLHCLIYVPQLFQLTSHIQKKTIGMEVGRGQSPQPSKGIDFKGGLHDTLCIIHHSGFKHALLGLKPLSIQHRGDQLLILPSANAFSHTVEIFDNLQLSGKSLFITPFSPILGIDDLHCIQEVMVKKASLQLMLEVRCCHCR